VTVGGAIWRKSEDFRQPTSGTRAARKVRPDCREEGGGRLISRDSRGEKPEKRKEYSPSKQGEDETPIIVDRLRKERDVVLYSEPAFFSGGVWGVVVVGFFWLGGFFWCFFFWFWFCLFLGFGSLFFFFFLGVFGLWGFLFFGGSVFFFLFFFFLFGFSC